MNCEATGSWSNLRPRYFNAAPTAWVDLRISIRCVVLKHIFLISIVMAYQLSDADYLARHRVNLQAANGVLHQ